MENTKEKYKYCNHHHEIGDKHELVDFGDGQFVANKEAIPLLKALNELGLRTRSHHIDEHKHAWICILLDNVEIEIKEVFESHADRTKYNGKKELLIRWQKDENLDNQISDFVENVKVDNEEFKYCMPDDINSKEEHDEYLKAIGFKK